MNIGVQYTHPLVFPLDKDVNFSHGEVMGYDIVIFFRRGWRWPLSAGDRIEIWEGAKQVGELPAEILIDLLRQQLHQAVLTGKILKETRKQLPS